jgi:hypothetical protein
MFGQKKKGNKLQNTTQKTEDIAMRDTFSQNKSMIEYVSRWYLILVNYC